MFEFQDALVTASLKHTLAWLVVTLTGLALTSLSGRKKACKGTVEGSPNHQGGSSLICDWCLTGSARDGGRASASNCVVGGAIHHFLF